MASDLREELKTWIIANLPGGTVIGDPNWWADKIAGIAERALAAQTAPAVEVPMPEPPKPTTVHPQLGELWDRFDLQRHAIAYGDARAAAAVAKVPEGWRFVRYADHIQIWLPNSEGLCEVMPPDGVIYLLAEAMLAAAPQPAAVKQACGGDLARCEEHSGACHACKPNPQPEAKADNNYRHSTHHVHRGPESLPCYCGATMDHQIGDEQPGAKPIECARCGDTGIIAADNVRGPCPCKAEAKAGADDDGNKYPAPLIANEDIHALSSLCNRLEDIKRKRWPAKDWDVSDLYVNANIGHAAMAAEWGLPALNRVVIALQDAAWQEGQKSREEQPKPAEGGAVAYVESCVLAAWLNGDATHLVCGHRDDARGRTIPVSVTNVAAPAGSRDAVGLLSIGPRIGPHPFTGWMLTRAGEQLREGEYRLYAGAAPAVDAEALRYPKARHVARIGDMDPRNALRVGLDDDGDAYLSCTAGFDGVEFCTIGAGGGKSPRTHAALIALMVAIEEDNAKHPAGDWLARRLSGAKDGG